MLEYIWAACNNIETPFGGGGGNKGKYIYI